MYQVNMKTCFIAYNIKLVIFKRKQNKYKQQKIANFKTLLTGYGFNEIITYSFVSEKEYDMFFCYIMLDYGHNSKR